MTKGQPSQALIVEDELLLLMDLEDRLTAMGYLVVGKATTLDRGCQLARELDIDFAVLDVNLSGANSAAIADELSSRGVPFVFVTGYTKSGIPERYRTCMSVAKPYETASLSLALQVALKAKPPL
ncbi:MAG: hypothetical protein Dbin4_00675 [Alphaproteobacteria bacterium]|nr:hypothetical protein [Alphaproteobacteria bacterium]